MYKTLNCCVFRLNSYSYALTLQYLENYTNFPYFHVQTVPLSFLKLVKITK